MRKDVDCLKLTKEDLVKAGYTPGICHDATEVGCQYYNPDNLICKFYDGREHPCCPAVLAELAEKEKTQKEKKIKKFLQNFHAPFGAFLFLELLSKNEVLASNFFEFIIGVLVPRDCFASLAMTPGESDGTPVKFRG